MREYDIKETILKTHLVLIDKKDATVCCVCARSSEPLTAESAGVFVRWQHRSTFIEKAKTTFSYIIFKI